MTTSTLTADDFADKEIRDGLVRNIKRVDVYTPKMYSVVVRDRGETYFTVVQEISQSEYLIRQILRLNGESRQLEDRTFDKDIIERVRRLMSGFIYPSLVKSWHDLRIPCKG